MEPRPYINKSDNYSNSDMNGDDNSISIFCLQHCGKRHLGLGRVPGRCPVCGLSLDQLALDLPPYSLPCPLAHAKDWPCCVVIRPAVEAAGFLSGGFSPGDDLHVALTDGTGSAVVGFGASGVHWDELANEGRSSWSECAVVNVVGVVAPSLGDDPDWPDYWDESLRRHSARWASSDYCQATRNCYDFVRSFFASLGHPFRLSPDARRSKVEFCRQHISPKMARVEKYIALHRRLSTSKGQIVTI